MSEQSPTPTLTMRPVSDDEFPTNVRKPGRKGSKYDVFLDPAISDGKGYQVDMPAGASEEDGEAFGVKLQQVANRKGHGLRLAVTTSDEGVVQVWYQVKEKRAKVASAATATPAASGSGGTSEAGAAAAPAKGTTKKAK